MDERSARCLIEDGVEKLNCFKEENLWDFVDCASHDKKKIKGYGGWLKNYLRRKIRGNVEYHTENVDTGKYTIVYIDMDEAGNGINVSDTVAKLRNNRDLTGRVPANTPRREAVYCDHDLSHITALVPKEDKVEFKWLKMKAKLENWKMGKISKNNGIAAMHHFHVEKWLIEKFTCCHIPYLCPWCVTQLSKPTWEERYAAPRDGCKLWPLMEIIDEEGKGTRK